MEAVNKNFSKTKIKYENKLIDIVLRLGSIWQAWLLLGWPKVSDKILNLTKIKQKVRLKEFLLKQFQLIYLQKQNQWKFTGITEMNNFTHLLRHIRTANLVE